VVAPLGTLNYLNIAVKKGILVKDGHVLEELSGIDTFIFDKTGTLTREIPEVGEIILCSDRYTENDILYYAAAAEQKSVHPIARAILKKAEDKQMILPIIEDSSYDIGYGISVEIEGKTIQIGSSRFMQMKGVEISQEMSEKMDEALATGHSVIMLAINSKLESLLEIHTLVRPEAKKTIQILRQHGIQCMAIVSGDHERPTKALADALEMNEYYYDVLPEEKANIVEKLQKKGKKVAIVGDGVNDTIAMEKADISISLSGASTVATDVAQVVLMDGSLTHIAELLELSRKLNKNLSRSLILNIIPNVVALNGVLFFHFGMLTTILVSQSPLVLGTINALLPVDSKSPHSIDDEFDAREAKSDTPDPLEKNLIIPV
jgi:Cu2+-exporting ATPase